MTDLSCGWCEQDVSAAEALSCRKRDCPVGKNAPADVLRRKGFVPVPGKPNHWEKPL